MGSQKSALGAALIALAAYLPAAGCSEDSCFAAGTPIATPRGPVPIEQLRVGDTVFTYDAERDRITAHPIMAVHEHDSQRLGQLWLAANPEPLWVTRNHPIYAPETGQYLPVVELPTSNTVLHLDADHELTLHAGARFSSTSRIDRVYNISVAGPHNYFAGGVLVHNKSAPVPTSTTTGNSSPATGLVASSASSSTGQVNPIGSGGAPSTTGSTGTTGTPNLGGAAGEPSAGGEAGEGGEGGGAGDG